MLSINNKMNVNYYAGNKLITFLISLYFFLCPIEFVFNSISPIGPPIKYLGIIIILVILFRAYFVQTHLIISWVHLGLISWCFIEVLSIFWTPSIHYALVYLSSYINVIIFFTIITVFKYTISQINLFLNFTLLGSTFAAILMLNSMSLYHGEGIRYTFSFLGAELDPNNAAAFLVYGVAISFFKTLNNKKGFSIFHLALFIINAVALFFTGSRGGFVASILSIIIITFSLMKNKSFFNSLVYCLKITLIVLTGLWILSLFIPIELLDRFLDFESYEGGSERTVIWDFAIQQLYESPIIGFGIGSFLNTSVNYFGHVKGMHNSYLMILFETGFLGITFFMSSIIILVLKIIKSRNYFALAILLCGLIPSLFLDALVKRFLWNGLILCAILIFNEIPRVDKSKEN